MTILKLGNSIACCLSCQIDHPQVSHRYKATLLGFTTALLIVLTLYDIHTNFRRNSFGVKPALFNSHFKASLGWF
jgi:hypothetical protein